MAFNIDWKEGIIGKMEKFLLDRYPIGKMWARAIPTSITSVALSNLKLEDKMGSVNANVFFLYPAPSGLGCKTPPLRFARELMKQWHPHFLSVEHFTPQGYVEYIAGTQHKQLKKREEIEPHPVNIIIRDEFSRFLHEKRSYNNAILEFFSELWDGWVGGSYTRKMQYEGNLKVFVSLLSATSHYFFSLLEKSFFQQGLGNRILWIVESIPEPKKLKENFFFDLGENDKEANALIEETKTRLDTLLNLNGVYVLPNAEKLWIDFQYKTALNTYKDQNLRGSFEIKQPLNTLKLAMIYSASRLNIHKEQGMLLINENEMKQAILDTEKYNEMWARAIELWELANVDERKETRLPSSKYDLMEMLNVAKIAGGLISVGTIVSALNCPDWKRITGVLGLGLAKGWLEIVAERNTQGTLTEEEYKRFKPARGISPQVFRITESGLEELKKRY
jgi:hypothetical protein